MNRSFASFFLLALLTATASASPLVVSTFDANREGWSATFGAAVGTGAIWQASGGNPAGNLVAPDSFAGTTTWYFSAASDSPPSPLLGNHADAYGGALEYDLRIENLAGNYYDTNSDFDVWLIGGGFTLVYDGGFQPGSSWSHFSIPLVASAGWQKAVVLPSTAPATESELQSALSNITSIQIRGNYTDAATTTHLDNVGFYAVPEPAGIALAGLALLGFMGLRRGRGRAV
jgi:hypothetical protein